MADTKPTVTPFEPKGATKPVTADEKPKASGPRAVASESSDPAVHQLMAELQTAQMNRAALEADEDTIKVADEKVEAAQKNLNDAGFK